MEDQVTDRHVLDRVEVVAQGNNEGEFLGGAVEGGLFEGGLEGQVGGAEAAEKNHGEVVVAVEGEIDGDFLNKRDIGVVEGGVCELS